MRLVVEHAQIRPRVVEDGVGDLVRCQVAERVTGGVPDGDDGVLAQAGHAGREQVGHACSRLVGEERDVRLVLDVVGLA